MRGTKRLAPLFSLNHSCLGITMSVLMMLSSLDKDGSCTEIQRLLTLMHEVLEPHNLDQWTQCGSPSTRKVLCLINELRHRHARGGGAKSEAGAADSAAAEVADAEAQPQRAHCIAREESTQVGFPGFHRKALVLHRIASNLIAEYCMRVISPSSKSAAVGLTMIHSNVVQEPQR